MNNMDDITHTTENTKVDSEVYANCMDEMKKRLLLIDRPEIQYLYGFSYLEYMCLQMRKICELFAFAAIAANRKSYEKESVDFQNDWSFKQILRVVKEVNPKYFPEALHPIPIIDKKNGRRTFKGFAGENISFLSEKDIAKIFNKCSDFVHAQNHFKNLHTFYPMDGHKFLPWKKKLREWRDEFIKLLNCHVIGHKDIQMFVVYMYMEDKDKNILVATIN